MFSIELVTFLITITKYLTNNLQEEEFILAYGFRNFSPCSIDSEPIVRQDNGSGRV
jgi:hypothetical protein